MTAFLDAAHAGNADLVIGVGDLFDLMVHGPKAFSSGQAIQQFLDQLGDPEFVYVAGNHDPLPWVDSAMQRLGQRLRAVPHYQLDLAGVQYYFAYGDGWAMDWRYLRKLNPLWIWLGPWGPVRWLVHWWADRVNPRGIKRRMKRLEVERDRQRIGSDEWERSNRVLMRERERYNKYIGWVHGGTGGHAETNKCVVICGHTHKPWKGDAFEKEKAVQRMHDDGDLVDSCTYLLIEAATASLHELEGKCKPDQPHPETWLDKATPC